MRRHPFLYTPERIISQPSTSFTDPLLGAWVRLAELDNDHAIAWTCGTSRSSINLRHQSGGRVMVVAGRTASDLLWALPLLSCGRSTERGTFPEVMEL
jgi:hypothetical protein